MGTCGGRWEIRRWEIRRWEIASTQTNPPSETKKGSGNLQSNELNEIFTTRVGGFCLCSRDFNRLVIIKKGSGNLQSNELNEIFTTRVGGFCLCSRDFNRLVIIINNTRIN